MGTTYAIKYQPYDAFAKALPSLFFLDLALLFLCIGFFVFRFWGIALISALFTIVLFIFATLCKISASLVFQFGDDGICVSEWRNADTYITWNNLQYGYYGRNVKGYLHIILSPCALTSKEVRRIVNTDSVSMDPISDKCIVIPMRDPSTQSNIAIQEYLSNKILFLGNTENM